MPREPEGPGGVGASVGTDASGRIGALDRIGAAGTFGKGAFQKGHSAEGVGEEKELEQGGSVLRRGTDGAVKVLAVSGRSLGGNP